MTNEEQALRDEAEARKLMDLQDMNAEFEIHMDEDETTPD